MYILRVRISVGGAVRNTFRFCGILVYSLLLGWILFANQEGRLRSKLVGQGSLADRKKRAVVFIMASPLSDRKTEAVLTLLFFS